MPELSMLERYTRQRRLINEALKYNWKVGNIETKLNEIIVQLNSYKTAKF